MFMSWLFVIILAMQAFICYSSSHPQHLEKSPLCRQSPYLNLDSSILSDKALQKNENEVAINLPADFVLEVPTKDEMCQMSDITENDHQKHIIKIRTELRNNIKVLDDLTFLSSSVKEMSEINTLILSSIKCLQWSVDLEGNLMKHKGETVQMSSATIYFNNRNTCIWIKI